MGDCVAKEYPVKESGIITINNTTIVVIRDTVYFLFGNLLRSFLYMGSKRMARTAAITAFNMNGYTILVNARDMPSSTMKNETILILFFCINLNFI
jgi:hypothetical protein